MATHSESPLLQRLLLLARCGTRRSAARRRVPAVRVKLSLLRLTDIHSGIDEVPTAEPTAELTAAADGRPQREAAAAHDRAVYAHASLDFHASTSPLTTRSARRIRARAPPVVAERSAGVVDIGGAHGEAQGEKHDGAALERRRRRRRRPRRRAARRLRRGRCRRRRATAAAASVAAREPQTLRVARTTAWCGRRRGRRSPRSSGGVAAAGDRVLRRRGADVRRHGADDGDFLERHGRVDVAIDYAFIEYDDGERGQVWDGEHPGGHGAVPEPTLLAAAPEAGRGGLGGARRTEAGADGRGASSLVGAGEPTAKRGASRRPSPR